MLFEKLKLLKLLFLNLNILIFNIFPYNLGFSMKFMNKISNDSNFKFKFQKKICKDGFCFGTILFISNNNFYDVNFRK